MSSTVRTRPVLLVGLLVCAAALAALADYIINVFLVAGYMSTKMAMSPETGVVKPTGETWAVENLFVCDGSVLPTSIGVNSQLPIMSIAMMLARGIVEDFDTYARRA